MTFDGGNIQNVVFKWIKVNDDDDDDEEDHRAAGCGGCHLEEISDNDVTFDLIELSQKFNQINFEFDLGSIRMRNSHCIWLD